jgi:molecular chaperone HtpG
MRSEDIVVGKHTLESLTIGMYADPFTIFREYIQNSADSIDEAVKEGIISENEGIVDVVISKRDASIVITDNGTGISTKDAYKALCDIGNSKKDYSENRGFRGIGRLGGLGYTEKLVFVTSRQGENKKATVTWNCSKLKEMLQPGKHCSYDLIQVIKEVTNYEVAAEDANAHYFVVRLEGINQQFEEVLIEDEVGYYLSTVAPVPFDCQKFIYANRIKSTFEKYGKKLEEYKLILNKSPKPILKKYKTNFQTGQQERTNQSDSITDIEFFEGYSNNEELLFLGWLGLCNFKGTIQDEYMRGIRIRKGNILIGDEHTFGQFFSSEPNRANGVFIGEVYIYWKDIIPNARRDDFEKNADYKILHSMLREKADEFNHKYRRGYSQINSAIRKYHDGSNRIEEMEQELRDGITSEVHKEKLLDEKQQVEQKVENAVSDLEKLKTKIEDINGKNNEVEEILKKHPSVKKKILALENKIIDTDYKGKNELSFLSRQERNIYRKIIEVIDRELEKDVAKALNAKIIAALKGCKNRKK